MEKRKKATGQRMGAEGPAALGEVLAFMRALWAVDHGLRSVSKRMAKRLGVTGPQRLVLRMVGRFPWLSAGDLAALLHLHPSTLTGVLDRLERRGLVRRRADPKDGRRALFTLSDRGRSINTVRAGTVEAAVRRALDGTPRGGAQAARELLAALVHELERDA